MKKQRLLLYNTTQLCKKNFYDDIVDCVIVKLTWNKIKQMCEFRSFNAFLIIYVKYEVFKYSNCETFYQYNVKFRKIDNELVIYFEKIRSKFDWLIFKYFIDLSKLVIFFIDRWIVEHNSINNKTKTDFKKKWRCSSHARLRISIC